MKKSRFSEEQVIKILRQAESKEQTIGDVCREHGICEQTFYRWRNRYGGMEVSDVLSVTGTGTRERKIKEVVCRASAGDRRDEGVVIKKVVGAPRKREAVTFLNQREMSERRGCALMSLSRSVCRRVRALFGVAVFNPSVTD